MPICICRRASRVLIPRKDKRAGPRKGGEGEEGTRRGTVGRTRFEEEVEKKIRMRMRSEGLGRGDVLIGIGDG